MTDVTDVTDGCGTWQADMHRASSLGPIHLGFGVPSHCRSYWNRALRCDACLASDLDDDSLGSGEVFVRGTRVDYWMGKRGWRVVREHGRLATYCPSCALTHFDEPTRRPNLP